MNTRIPALLLALAASTAVAPRAHAGTETVLYAFQGGLDGAVPVARLLYANGVLYGTTSQGGAPYNLGTVFQATLTGAETVLARFPGGNLGATPLAGLTELNGLFYGTTSGGGAPDCYVEGNPGCGVVYVFNPSAGLSPLHVFRGEPTDGAAPATDLTVRHGTLFGATRAGGTYGSGDDGGGTVFKITPGAGQHTLFTFFGDQQMNNGTTPLGAPTFGGKLFYGTLASQGANLGGQIFSTDGQGHVTYLYSFPTLSQMPLGDFLNVHGQLYGVTDAGGAHGCGEVYRLDPSDSSVHVLYSFGGKPDGCGPTAGVTYLHGKFFGTTSRGGAHAAGTIYELRTDGTEHVAHSFGEPHDGAHPAAALIAIGSTLYGTTQDGGLWDQGTVFAFTPGPN